MIFTCANLFLQTPGRLGLLSLIPTVGDLQDHSDSVLPRPDPYGGIDCELCAVTAIDGSREMSAVNRHVIARGGAERFLL